MITLWWNLLNDRGVSGAGIAFLALGCVLILAVSLADGVRWLAYRLRPLPADPGDGTWREAEG